MPKSISRRFQEVRKAKVDCQMVIYGGAVDSFTNPESGNDPSKGAAHNEKAVRLFFHVQIDKAPWTVVRQSWLFMRYCMKREMFR